MLDLDKMESSSRKRKKVCAFGTALFCGIFLSVILFIVGFAATTAQSDPVEEIEEVPDEIEEQPAYEWDDEHNRQTVHPKEENSLFKYIEAYQKLKTDKYQILDMYMRHDSNFL